MSFFSTAQRRIYPLAQQADSILRPSSATSTVTTRSAGYLWSCTGLMVAAAFIYGATLGSYGFVVGARSLSDQWLQMLYSSLKVPLLFSVTTSLALPSFFVFNTLANLRVDWQRSFRALIVSQSAIALILVSFGPITLLVHASVSNTSQGYQITILFNGLLFAIASLAAQAVLRREYLPLIQRDPRHRIMLRVWWLLYALVGIQAGWTMRPFIGSPDAETVFFRMESWTNAYVRILQMIGEVLKKLVS